MSSAMGYEGMDGKAGQWMGTTQDRSQYEMEGGVLFSRQLVAYTFFDTHAALQNTRLGIWGFFSGMGRSREVLFFGTTFFFFLVASDDEGELKNEGRVVMEDLFL